MAHLISEKRLAYACAHKKKYCMIHNIAILKQTKKISILRDD